MGSRAPGAFELQLKPEPKAQKIEVRRERAERRQQLTQAMAEKASVLDQHLRFFFQKARKR